MFGIVRMHVTASSVPLWTPPLPRPSASQPKSGSARLLAQGRHAAILSVLRRDGGVQVAAIAAELGVSEMTIRRDLAELDGEGHLTRIHGGAVPAGGVAMDREEPRFDQRLAQRRAVKERIAAAAAALCADSRTIALDVGTTTYLLAEQLAGRSRAKIFTNSLRAATALSEAAAEVYVAGGRVRGEELSIGGASALAQFGELWFDVAFIGVSGLTADGFFDYSFEDCDLKQLYVRRSALKVVLCDSSKFQRMSLVLVAPLADADLLVTDAAPPTELASALASAGVDVRIAPARG